MVKKESVRIIEYEEIGKVSFIRKTSARNLKITIKPFRNVLVSVPAFISFEAAGNFVAEKHQWIKKSQARFTKYSKGITIFEESTAFHTRDHILILNRHEKSTIQTIIRNGQIVVLFPDYADVKDPRVQKAIRKAILAAYRMEAQRHLPEMLRKLARQYNFQYGRVTLRNNKTRWGSCSKDNAISLNIHLMRLPQHLQEYIGLHELCHTVHKHHQKAFWQHLDKVTGGRARILDKELNGFSPEVW
jgi:predicted metal-dependent hydrolase